MRAKGDSAKAIMRAEPLGWGVLVVRRYAAFWWGDARVAFRYWLNGEMAHLKHLLFLAPALAAGAGLWRLRGERAIAGVFLAIFLTFPLPYVLAHTYPRYRLPIEPLLVLCAAVTLVRVWRSRPPTR